MTEPSSTYLNDLRKVLIIIFCVTIIFILNKFLFRPYILAGSFPEVLKIFTLSLPNLLEAIVGTLVLSNLALVLKSKGYKFFSSLSNMKIYILAVLAAAIYVITQEFKIHNLGGRNQYDPFDVLFSIVGLFIAYGILLKIKPKIS